MPGQNSRMRAYRLYVKRSICLKNIQEDNFPKHKLTKYQNNPLCKASIPVDSKQQKLGFSSKSDPNEVASSADKNSNIRDQDKNPDDPEASLFSRLHLMQNYRLINDRLCLLKTGFDSSKGTWGGSYFRTDNDPYITKVPSEKDHEDITHVKLYSCTWMG